MGWEQDIQRELARKKQLAASPEARRRVGAGSGRGGAGLLGGPVQPTVKRAPSGHGGPVQTAKYNPAEDAALHEWLATLAPSTPGMALPTVTPTPPTPAFQWGDLSNLGPPAEPAFQWGDLEALQAIQDADTAATGVTGSAPAFTGGLGGDINAMATQSLDDWNAFLTSLGGGGDAVITTGGDDGVVVTGDEDPPGDPFAAQKAACALRPDGVWNPATNTCDTPTTTGEPEDPYKAQKEACALRPGGVWNPATNTCDTPTATGEPADPYAEAKAQCALNNGMWDSTTNTCTPIFQGAGAFDPTLTVDPKIEQQAGDQISIVEKALQQKNRSIQQALQAGLLSIGDAQKAWDESRAEIYQDFLTEQGLITSGFATEQEEAAGRRTTDRNKLITALNAAGVDSNLVADELAMIDEMYQGGATEQSEYLDAMGRIGTMSDADRRMMGQGIFGGYEQDLRSGIRDLQLATNFEGADESKLARERGLQALGLSDFTGVDPETLYAALYAGVDVPGMAYGTSEREAGQDWATLEREAGEEWRTGEAELDRALATDKFNESVRQFNWLGGRQDAATRTDISQWNKMFAREGSQYEDAQDQYQDALDLEAERYATEREDIADALGLEAERFELGRDMDPASEFAGMTKSQQWEHKRLTAKALASAGADVDAGSFLSRVASTMLLTGYEAADISDLQDQIDGYLADNMRGDDLSDENVLAALLWLGKTDIAMGALQGLSEEQLEGLTDAVGGVSGTTTVAAGTPDTVSTAPQFSPDVGQSEAELWDPEGSYGVLDEQRPGAPSRQLRDESGALTAGARLQGTRLNPDARTGGSGSMFGDVGRTPGPVYEDTNGERFTQAKVDAIEASMPVGWTDPAYGPGGLGYIDYIAQVGLVFDEAGRAGEEQPWWGSNETAAGRGRFG